jgi:hypothetical protein
MFDALKKKIHHRNWPQVTAEVMSCKYHNPEAVFLAAGAGPAEEPYYTVAFDYVVNGQTYTGGLLSEVGVQKGDKFPVRYDPKNPAHNSSDPLPNWMRIYDACFYGAVSAALVWFWFRR